MTTQEKKLDNLVKKTLKSIVDKELELNEAATMLFTVMYNLLQIPEVSEQLQKEFGIGVEGLSSETVLKLQHDLVLVYGQKHET